MSIPLREAPFTITGGTTARSLDERFSDVINVAEFASLNVGGTFGENSGNDSPCFQAAFDLAFGSAASPHGETNKYLNRPVFVPAGQYRIEDTLTLTQIVGGRIYGAGCTSTRLKYEGSFSGFTPLLDINGASDLTIEHLYFENAGPGGDVEDSDSCVINLDWADDDTASGSDGLHDNHFIFLRIGGGEWAVIIAKSGNEGHNNLFQDCSVQNGMWGYDVRGSAAVNNNIIGGGGGCHTALVRCPSGGGQMHAQAFNIGGQPDFSTDADFVMESGHVMNISGGRSETYHNILRQESGIVTMQGVNLATNPTTFAEINGGKCIIQGCFIGNTAQIIGTGGELYISACYAVATTPLSGYSGTLRWDPDALSGSIVP